jgi:hypothetical protein
VQQDPATRVSAPAIGLIVTGVLGIIFVVLGMLMVGVVGLAAFADPSSRDALPSVGVSMGFGVIALALSALTAYAGWQMRQLRSWGLCMAGAIVGMLPCSGCCLLGLPIGIWAIIVLIDNETKQAFDGGAPPDGGYGGPPPGYGGPQYPPQA